eukprot:CAMPEP_0196198342 /NCGR_PEP_ID=MMETSP0912-20130531/2434_1 /TAXON_ID=49265 /ORGANISM="Thalassiosira rotula, Strain GSO102" /LENGTH=35 /DNA_ID= /DNA_START= /DNA_END= /DNA_ORIENTATION=
MSSPLPNNFFCVNIGVDDNLTQIETSLCMCKDPID